MNKYVRTNKNVYLVLNESENVVIGGKTLDDFGDYIHKSDIVASADKIDEIIDGYYLYNGYDDAFEIYNRIFKKTNKQDALDEYVSLKDHIELMCRNRYICELKAFIETENGLIFVANVNEKGNAKLI